MTAPTLETERLLLVPPRLNLFDAHAAIFANPRVTAHIGGGPRSRQDSWRAYCMAAGTWSLVGYGYWSVLDRASGALVGNAGLGRFERGIAALEGFAEMGWAFGADWWGLGYASEVGRAVVGWADAALGTELRCLITQDNAASLRVAAKLGFTTVAEITDQGDPCVVMARPARDAA